MGLLSDGAVFSRQRTVCEALKTRECGSYTAHYQESSLNSALSVTFHPCESRGRPPAAQGTGSLPSVKENTHPNTGARQGQENLAWPRPHWLSCFPGLALQHLLPEGFLLSHNNYLKILKFLAASGDASRNQGINCHMQFPIPCPEPAWLKLVQFCASFCMEITAISSC